jgi:hypothetical protein
VSDTRIHFDWQDYPIEQLIGAIKMRVQSAGGALSSIDAMAIAKGVKQEQDYLAERERLFRDQKWIDGTVRVEAEKAVTKIKELIDRAKNELGLNSDTAIQNLQCVARAGSISMLACWEQHYTNSVSEAAFVVSEWEGPIVLPIERRMALSEPRLLKKRKYTADITIARDFCWKLERSDDELNTEQLCDDAVSSFFNLVADKARKQKR